MIALSKDSLIELKAIFSFQLILGPNLSNSSSSIICLPNIGSASVASSYKISNLLRRESHGFLALELSQKNVSTNSKAKTQFNEIFVIGILPPDFRIDGWSFRNS